MKFLTIASALLLIIASPQSSITHCRAQDNAKRQLDQPDPADVAKLVGTYRITAGERNGKKIDADRLADVTVKIEKKVITTFDKDKKEFYGASYELETTEKPWKIVMTATVVPVAEKGSKADGKGSKAEGLIEISGETVRLIYALPEGKAPTEFKTGEKQQMFVLMRTDIEQGKPLAKPEKPR